MSFTEPVSSPEFRYLAAQEDFLDVMALDPSYQNPHSHNEESNLFTNLLPPCSPPLLFEASPSEPTGFLQSKDITTSPTATQKKKQKKINSFAITAGLAFTIKVAPNQAEILHVHPSRTKVVIHAFEARSLGINKDSTLLMEAGKISRLIHLILNHRDKKLEEVLNCCPLPYTNKYYTYQVLRRLREEASDEKQFIKNYLSQALTKTDLKDFISWISTIDPSELKPHKRNPTHCEYIKKRYDLIKHIIKHPHQALELLLLSSNSPFMPTVVVRVLKNLKSEFDDIPQFIQKHKILNLSEDELYQFIDKIKPINLDNLSHVVDIDNVVKHTQANVIMHCANHFDKPLKEVLSLKGALYSRAILIEILKGLQVESKNKTNFVTRYSSWNLIPEDKINTFIGWINQVDLTQVVLENSSQKPKGEVILIETILAHPNSSLDDIIQLMKGKNYPENTVVSKLQKLQKITSNKNSYIQYCLDLDISFSKLSTCASLISTFELSPYLQNKVSKNNSKLLSDTKKQSILIRLVIDPTNTSLDQILQSPDICYTSKNYAYQALKRLVKKVSLEKAPWLIKKFQKHNLTVEEITSFITWAKHVKLPQYSNHRGFSIDLTNLVTS